MKMNTEQKNKTKKPESSKMDKNSYPLPEKLTADSTQYLNNETKGNIIEKMETVRIRYKNITLNNYERNK
jgi:hypothetical protein